MEITAVSKKNASEDFFIRAKLVLVLTPHKPLVTGDLVTLSPARLGSAYSPDSHNHRAANRSFNALGLGSTVRLFKVLIDGP